MNIFIYDYTFEGLLTCIFDAYFRKTFPDLLLKEGEPLPLFYDETFHVSTDERKAMRVWRGLEKKISHHALSALTYCWLSELPEVDKRLFRYIRKARAFQRPFCRPTVAYLRRETAIRILL